MMKKLRQVPFHSVSFNRDNYIFIDTLTKFPVPNKLEVMIERKEIEFSVDQIIKYKEIFDKVFTSI